VTVDDPDEGVASVRPGEMTALLKALAAIPERMEVEPSPLAPGTVVGRFEVLREVGRGGFGIVYEARDRELGRSVAFKLVRSSRRSLADQLLHEAETVARLSHPNLITLHDVGRTEQGPYLVLEFLAGRTLQARLDEAPMAVEEALHVALEVARGMAYAHGEGVLHRDLKPGNVFLCDRGAVKILDFGMAHAFDRTPLSGGTPAYMAPEQWTDAPEDARTDVFALGVMLHRMLVGRLPFPGPDGCAVGLAPAPPLEVPGAPELGRLVGRMLERDPGRRPADGGEVQAALVAIRQSMDRPGAPAEGTAGEGEAARPARRSRRPLRSAATLAGLVLAATLAGWFLGGRQEQGAPALLASGGPVGVAVLPFRDLSPDQDQEYLSDGVAEEILAALSRQEGLRVPGRASSFYFKGRSATPGEVARRLGVTHALEGTVLREGQRLRVTAQLLRLDDGERLWSGSFDRDLAELFAVQDEVARKVVGALRERLRPDLRVPRPADRLTSPEVYRLYLLGRHLLARSTQPDLDAAIRVLKRAVTLDPGHAPSRVWLAYGTWEHVNLGPPPGATAGAPAFDTLVAGEAALREADALVALAPELGDAFWMRGFFRSCVSWDWAGATSDYQRALALAPGETRTRLDYAGILAVTGRLEEARELAAQAAASDPLYADVYRWLGDFQAAAGDPTAAIGTFRLGLEVEPNHAYLLRELGLALLLARRPVEARAAFERHPVPWMRDMGLALVEFTQGREEASRQALQRLVALGPAAPAYQLAEVHAWRGEPDQAFRWLEAGYASRDPGMNYLLFDPLLRSLRADPRFATLRRKLRLPGG
jgi:eukaryotic-like serine/threonine-protein kinase